jgi:hypothetical protein
MTALTLDSCGLEGEFRLLLHPLFPFKEEISFPYALSYQSYGVHCFLYVLTVFCIVFALFFVGIIPAELGQLVNLWYLDLSKNKLAGNPSHLFP